MVMLEGEGEKIWEIRGYMWGEERDRAEDRRETWA
jgi:hypothetical protein